MPFGTASRLLQVQRTTGEWSDKLFREFPELLRPDDLLVFNNTRVFPARLYGRRDGAPRSADQSSKSRRSVIFSKAASKFYLRGKFLSNPTIGSVSFVPDAKSAWANASILVSETNCKPRSSPAQNSASVSIRFQPGPVIFYHPRSHWPHSPSALHLTPRSSLDRERYQTVYAEQRGSVAAPTAGLHFTPEILTASASATSKPSNITLHVGLGTFQPIRVERVEDHKIHSESYSISAAAAAAINQALADSRRIIAVGTTTVRALEHAASLGSGTITPGVRGR